MMFGPNITGVIGMQRSDTDAYFYASGGFYGYGSVSGKGGYTGRDPTGGQAWGFSAARSDGTFGSGSTVQPPSMSALFCIKF